MADIVRLEENGVAKYIETHVNAVVGLESMVNGNSKVLFNGSAQLVNSDKYSYNWDELKIGIFLQFSRYDPGKGPLDYGYADFFIPKQSIPLVETKARYLAMPDSSQTTITKTVRITKYTIYGDDGNDTDPFNKWAVRRVIAV